MRAGSCRLSLAEGFGRKRIDFESPASPRDARSNEGAAKVALGDKSVERSRYAAGQRRAQRPRRERELQRFGHWSRCTRR
jgi:hypothetical protein